MDSGKSLRSGRLSRRRVQLFWTDYANRLIFHEVSSGAGFATRASRTGKGALEIGNDLMKFVETVRVAKRCRSIILQNFYGTLIVDTIGIGLAAAGYLNPLLAAFIHVASELTFILNSTRLLPPRESQRLLSRILH
jgi:P-type Cu+ transporter